MHSPQARYTWSDSATARSVTTPPPRANLLDQPARVKYYPRHMMERRGLRHAAYFEALATLDPTSVAWRTTSAGLVTLRLFDRWVQCRAEGRALPADGLHAVGNAVRRIERNCPLFDPLHALWYAMAEPTGTSPLASVAAYGRALHAAAEWPLAIDAYLTFTEHAGPDDAVIRGDVCLRVEACQRMVLATLRVAGLAETPGPCDALRRAVLGRIAEAAAALHRGNLPAAETMLEAARAEALTAGLGDLLAAATHGLGDVFYHRATAHPGGKVHAPHLDRAAQHFFDAFRRYTEPASRDRALVDLATTLAARGLRDAARDGLQVLYCTSATPDVQWSAALSLMDDASRARDRAAFERYRDELIVAPLLPALEARLHVLAGDGERRFGDTAAARAAYARAVAIAEEHALNEILMLAEAAAAAAEPCESSAAAEPGDLVHVVQALDALRAATGAA